MPAPKSPEFRQRAVELALALLREQADRTDRQGSLDQ